MIVKRNITPALEAFAAAISGQVVIAQAQIRKAGSGFELRHVDDRDREANLLETVGLNELRRVAQFAANGAFRPLKSAPNLRPGWRALSADVEELGLCLDALYPGAVADWYSLKNPESAGGNRLTSYRDFTQRQSGMYRITTMLDDRVAETVIRVCCHRDFCLKRRLWTLDGAKSPADGEAEKSIIPCLEPCAILLEFARKVARLEQDEKRRADSGGETAAEKETGGTEEGDGGPVAESDFDSPRNPRRARFDLEKKRLAGIQQ
jgi:hypothetical protein